MGVLNKKKKYVTVLLSIVYLLSVFLSSFGGIQGETAKNSDFFHYKSVSETIDKTLKQGDSVDYSFDYTKSNEETTTIMGSLNGGSGTWYQSKYL